MTQDTIEQVIATLTFNESGLIPAIAQEATSKDVLMMAWMNADAVRETLAPLDGKEREVLMALLDRLR